MTVILTPLAKLNPYRAPCTVAARVKLIRPAPQALVRWEGILKDESGEAIFSVWKNSGTRRLRPGKRYLFYRVEVGKREGRNEIRIRRESEVFPSPTDRALGRRLTLLKRREDKQRQRLARKIKITPRDRAPRDPVFYRAAVTAGVLVAALSAVLVLTGVVTEEKIRSWFISRRSPPPPPARTETVRFRGRVLAVEPEGSLEVAINGEEWIIHFLGIELPPRPGAGETFDPLIERIYAYLNYALEGREIELEMESWLPAEEEEAWAYVFVDDRLMNAELLQRGFALPRPAPHPLIHGNRMRRAGENARSRGIGLWRP